MKHSRIFPATLVLICCSIALSGCGSKQHDKGKYELLAQNGSVYRLNKQTGEVLFINSTWSEVIQGTSTNEVQTNHLTYLGEVKPNWLGDIKLSLKTTWRQNTLYYIFTMSPYDHVSSIIKTTSNAQLVLTVLDHDGFKLLAIPITLADLSATPGDKLESFQLNENMPCDLDTYQRIDGYSVHTVGF
jgi:hypothetical protein